MTLVRACPAGGCDQTVEHDGLRSHSKRRARLVDHIGINGPARQGRRGRAGRGLAKARARRGERRTRRRAAAPLDDYYGSISAMRAGLRQQDLDGIRFGRSVRPGLGAYGILALLMNQAVSRLYMYDEPANRRQHMRTKMPSHDHPTVALYALMDCSARRPVLRALWLLTPRLHWCGRTRFEPVTSFRVRNEQDGL